MAWLASDTAIYIGMVYSYLPFMVLPLYATLEKLDDTLLEAAADLGCTALEAFWLVTAAAVAAGRRGRRRCCASSRSSANSSSPICSAARDTLMIGQTLWTEFFANSDWPVASALAVALLGLLLRADHGLSAPAAAPVGGRAVMRRGASPFNVVSVALGLAFLYLPIAILVIYSFNASRLVTVWGGWSLAGIARC